MGKRGPKPKNLIDTTWSADLAYAVGLLASDGCLIKGQYLVDLTSKDIEQLNNYKKCLRIDMKIGVKSSSVGNKAFRVQFKNLLFYSWLQDIGLTPNKSKTIGKLKIPAEYFFDFLRGEFDGDGCTHSYFDKRWPSSFMFYSIFVSASEDYIHWLREEIKKKLDINGHITNGGKKSIFQLKYAKGESLVLLRAMYYSDDITFLKRKRLKIDKTLGIVGEHL